MACAIIGGAFRKSTDAPIEKASALSVSLSWIPVTSSAGVGTRPPGEPSAATAAEASSRFRESSAALSAFFGAGAAASSSFERAGCGPCSCPAASVAASGGEARPASLGGAVTAGLPA